MHGIPHQCTMHGIEKRLLGGPLNLSFILDSWNFRKDPQSAGLQDQYIGSRES